MLIAIGIASDYLKNLKLLIAVIIIGFILGIFIMKNMIGGFAGIMLVLCVIGNLAEKK